MTSASLRATTSDRACLDWSERHDYQAGALGAALLERTRALGWAGAANNSRAVVFTDAGERSFRALFAAAASTA